MDVNSQFTYNSNTYGAGSAGITQQVIVTSTSQSNFQVPHNVCLSGLSPDQMSQLMQVINLPKVEASVSQSGPPAPVNQTVTLALINVDHSQHVGRQILFAPPAVQFQHQSEVHQQPVLLPHCNQIPGMSISNPTTTTRLQLHPASSIAPALAAANVLESSINLPVTPVSADLRPMAYQLPNYQAPVFTVVSTMPMESKTLPSFTTSSVSSSSTMPPDKFKLQMNDLATPTPGYDFVVSEQPSQTMFEEPISILSNDGMKLNLSHQGIESALSVDPLDYKTQSLFYACDSNEQKQPTTEMLPATAISQQIQPIQSEMSGFISMPSVTSMFHMPDEQQDIEDSNDFFQPTDLQTDLITQESQVAPQAPMPIIGTVASISAPLVQAVSLVKTPTKCSRSKGRTNKPSSAPAAAKETAQMLVSPPPMADCLNEATSDCSSSDLTDCSSVDINTKEVAQRVISELKLCGIPQAVFAQQVLCRSQGTLSDLLRNPKPWSKLKSGRETFRRMWKWLQIPAADRISSLRSASLKRKEEFCTGLLSHEEQLLNTQQQQQQAISPAKPVVLQPQCQSPQPSATASKCLQPSAAPPAKKPRLVFTDIQRRTLHAIFNETNRPSREMQCTIAEQLGLELATVSNFFMNARRRSLEKWQESADGDPATALSAIEESDDDREATVDEANNEAGADNGNRDCRVQFARPLPPPPPLQHFGGAQAAAATADPALLLCAPASSASSSSSVSSSPTDAFSVCSAGL